MDENTAVAPGLRRRRAAALAGLLLVGALAACGPKGGSTGASASLTTPPASASTSSAASASAPPASTPTTPSTTGGSTGATVSPTLPSNPGIASGEPAPVKLPALGYQSMGDMLTVYFYGGTCEEYGLKADESQQGKVLVRVVVTKPAAPGKVCSHLVKKNNVAAQLSHPLQGRAVVDQATGETLTLDAGPAGGPQ
ncbi:hypothetical protein ABT095_16735 [Kitasatospora sp. NPDC002227]|uniref:hypothetical protein n=1 Tax=Kitasatospora sp. NPDC002227 TaxID=3154773 RepID=UPI0033265915